MNDYNFGNYIFKKRQETKMSQSQLADILGITNKAVSKWENGKAKPTTNTLRKMAALWQIPIDELLKLKGDEKKMEISKIVITGGPCAGKSTAMSWVQNGP